MEKTCDQMQYFTIPTTTNKVMFLHQGASQHNIQTETHISVDNNEAQRHLGLGVSRCYCVQHNADTCDYIELYHFSNYYQRQCMVSGVGAS